MHSNNATLFAGTPDVTILDNRGLSVRDIRYHRHPDTPDRSDEQITRHVFTALGHLQSSTDPRLHASGVNNFEYQTTLSGQPLLTSGVDNGTTVTLNDIAGRPSLGISATGVVSSWQYEDDTLPGRPLSLTERAPNEELRVTERFIWAGNSPAEQNLNLAGQCLRHYDTAGRSQIDSVGLTGAQLSVSRQLLQEDVEADWQGSDESTWQNMLAPEVFTTQSTADATGAALTTTDAKGNVQRMAYDVAGLLSGSWLTLKSGIEQVIVKSLTYSAGGQKLREEHGNGVVTSYSYEPETQRLIGIKTERPTGHNAGAKVLQDLRYDYDPVGNVLKISNDAEEARFWRNQKVVPENTYTYDSLYQLVSATGREMANAGQQGCNLPSTVIPLPTDSSTYTNYTRTYTYDNAGNLTQIRHSAPASGNNYTTNITISDRSNRGVLSTLTDNSADVDKLFTAGGQQRLLLPGQNLVWTPRNELLKVTPVVRDGSTDDRESYRYDSSSQRILKVSTQKTNNSTQIQRVQYLPGLELRSTTRGVTETESLQVITMGEAGRAQVRVLHWNSGRPADINNDQVRYSYDNLIGSSGLELDKDGNVISLEEYYPYGGTAVWTARNAVEANYKTVRYSGKERDATGLYYYGYRYYQPWAGRWLSADPAGTVDGLNLFRMVRNNPIRWFDYYGLTPEEWATREAFKHLPYSIHEQGTHDLLSKKRREQLDKRELFGHRSSSQPYTKVDEQFNLHAIKSEEVTVYRTEVEIYSDKFMHTHIDNGGVNIYVPGKTAGISNKMKNLSLKASQVGWYTASKDFLSSHPSDGNGNFAFYNFGNPLRALQFYEQKTENPKEKFGFVIKSFRIPSATFKAIAEDAVMEDEDKKPPNAPLNVDKAAYNQLGLRPHHVDLISASIIPGSGKVHKPAEHYELMDLGLSERNVSLKNLKMTRKASSAL